VRKLSLCGGPFVKLLFLRKRLVKNLGYISVIWESYRLVDVCGLSFLICDILDESRMRIYMNVKTWNSVWGRMVDMSCLSH